MANSATGEANDYNTKIIEEFRVEPWTRRRAMGGHHADPHPPHRRQVRDRSAAVVKAATVADHLRKVFTTLGISSRSQLAKALPPEPD